MVLLIKEKKFKILFVLNFDHFSCLQVRNEILKYNQSRIICEDILIGYAPKSEGTHSTLSQSAFCVGERGMYLNAVKRKTK